MNPWLLAYLLAGVVTAVVTTYGHRAVVREMVDLHAGRTVVVLACLLTTVAVFWPWIAVCGVIHRLTPRV